MAAAAVGAAGTARWALLAGNFAIGCGVMVVAGSLNDLVRSLQVSVALGGQLIAAGAFVIAVGAPLLAALVGGRDRRQLLTFALLWYAAGHLACALMPSYAALLPLRALTMLGAAVFTPQAAAAISAITPPAQRGSAIAFIFVGWSLASVVGMPISSFIGETAGWPSAFALVGALSAGAAVAVWRSVPGGIRPAALTLAAWRSTLTHPLLMGIVAVTALSAAGQFTLFAYFAPYYRVVLHASPADTSLLFLWFGAFGLLGNLLLQRHIDRLGAARCVTLSLALMTSTMLLWPLATSVPVMALLITPWALGCFSSNSAQQARLGGAAPALASALMALNTSAMYLGQAVGAAGGGALLAAGGFGLLSRAGFGWLLLAMALSALLARRQPGPARA